jgi:hypothetical protein
MERMVGMSNRTKLIRLHRWAKLGEMRDKEEREAEGYARALAERPEKVSDVVWADDCGKELVEISKNI